jgi:hypothetical protein
MDLDLDAVSCLDPRYDGQVLRALPLTVMIFAGCGTTQYRGPALLSGVGALMAGGGAVAFALGDRLDSRGRETSVVAEQVGLVSLMVGLGAIFAGGMWAASISHCDADADCPETEYCQKQFTTAGPYGHCVGR